MKIITITTTEGITTEFQGSAFKDVYEAYKGQNVIMKLDRYDESTTGIGYDFIATAEIGNCLSELTQNNYWEAYDQIFTYL